MNKPFFCEGSDAMVELESMIDKVGIANVVYALESICFAKGQHLRANWQDANTAKAWERNAVRLRTAAGKLERTD